MKKNYIRKIIKNNRESYYINIPKDMIKDLRWQDNQQLVVQKKDKSLILKDWQPK
jgi:antitoxin component of MazEF toxin-antitoxin module